MVASDCIVLYDDDDENYDLYKKNLFIERYKFDKPACSCLAEQVAQRLEELTKFSCWVQPHLGPPLILKRLHIFKSRNSNASLTLHSLLLL